MPKKPPKDAERNDRRDALEVLRDDCQRHQDKCVSLRFCEGNRLVIVEEVDMFVCRALKSGRCVEMATVGGDSAARHRARALLTRLGEVIPPNEEMRGAEPTELAMFTLAMAARAQTSWYAPQGVKFSLASGSTDDAAMRRAGMVMQTKRNVPDIRAAIAEVCRVLLRDKPPVAPRTRRTLDHLIAEAMLVLSEEHKRTGKLLTDKQVATRIKLDHKHFSKSVVGKSAPRHAVWKKYRANFVQGRREESELSRKEREDDERARRENENATKARYRDGIKRL